MCVGGRMSWHSAADQVGMRYLPHASGLVFLCPPSRARSGSSAVLTFAPAPRRRSLSGQGTRRTAPPPPFVPAFVPLRVVASRFVRHSYRDTHMTSMVIHGSKCATERPHDETGDSAFAN